MIEAAKTVTYTVSNTGSGDLSVSNITVSGATNITGTPTISRTSFTVAESGSETFTITYTPTGTVFGFNEITSDDATKAPITSLFQARRPETYADPAAPASAVDQATQFFQVTNSINQRAQFIMGSRAAGPTGLSLTPAMGKVSGHSAGLRRQWHQHLWPYRGRASSSTPCWAKICTGEQSIAGYTISLNMAIGITILRLMRANGRVRRYLWRH